MYALINLVYRAPPPPPPPPSLREKSYERGCALLTNLAEAIITMGFLNARRKMLLADNNCLKFVLSLTVSSYIFHSSQSSVSIIPLFVLLYGLI